MSIAAILAAAQLSLLPGSTGKVCHHTACCFKMSCLQHSWSKQPSVVGGECRRNVRLRSGQHLNFNFNPASLLSLGDAMAFTDALFDVNFNDPSFTREPTSLGRPARVGAPENAPQLHEQMAQRGSITSRVPQKYLIQNQSGLRLYYWAEEVGPWAAWVLNVVHHG